MMAATHLTDRARMIHEAAAASADTRLWQAVSPFSPSTYCPSRVASARVRNEPS